ncbi:MAG: MBOAT family O-acyltransferase, partial [Angelakisella sp.]
IDYLMALVIDRYREHPTIPKLMVALTLCANLGFLIIFKYSGFLVESVNSLTGLGLPVPQIALPIGISFYTFQIISYVIDIYRDDVPVQRNFWKFLLYVSMFHQLVAGPIVRYAHIAHEIDHRQASMEDISHGINRFMVGLSKKVIFANGCGQMATSYMAAAPQNLTALSAWFGLAMYSMQFYFDFSGYSDMAIGMGRMFGFHYYENFDYPFISQSVSEYWRRWHISLGTWFKDYLFYPLMMSGGFRKFGKWGKARFGKKNGALLPTVAALCIVWLATGLWHGANWNFVIWGLYFGFWLIVEMLFLGKMIAKLPRFFRHVYLMVIVMVGFGIFNFSDMASFGAFLGVLMGFGTGSDPTLALTVSGNIYFIIISVLFCTPAVPYLWKRIAEKSERTALVLEGLRVPANLAILLLCTALLVGQSYNPFMYFRF